MINILSRDICPSCLIKICGYFFKTMLGEMRQRTVAPPSMGVLLILTASRYAFHTLQAVQSVFTVEIRITYNASPNPI